MTSELCIPDELVATLVRLTSDVESFALEALQARAREVELNEQLAEEYRFAAVENKPLVREFSAI